MKSAISGCLDIQRMQLKKDYIKVLLTTRKVHNAISFFTTGVIVNQVKMLMFYNDQTTNLTFIHKYM